MKEKFSDRIGETKPNDAIQVGKMNNDLRNSLWNTLLRLTGTGDMWWSNLKIYYEYYFRLPINTVPNNYYDCEKDFYERYFNMKWYEVYNLIEFIVNYISVFNKNQGSEFAEIVFNKTLEEEKSGYRFIERKLIEISNKVEIESIEKAIQNSKELGLTGINKHFVDSLDKLSKKPDLDYRNSIKV